MIVLDTSATIALLDRSDDQHQSAVASISAEQPPFVVPAATLGELGHFIARRLGGVTRDAFLADLETGAFTLDCGDTDLARVRELAARLDDLGLGLVDASVIACAERLGGRVMTFDRRDFDVVARDVALTILP